jgi:hypothetical protein
MTFDFVRDEDEDAALSAALHARARHAYLRLAAA